MAAGRLYGVGVGPGDPELVTVRAARLIAEADVVAYHCARHGHSVARAAAAPYLRPGQAEEVLRYPVTTEDTDHPGGYAGALADFYTDAAARIAAHLEVGRTVVVLCEGIRAFTVPTSISTFACGLGSAHRSCPGSRPFPRQPPRSVSRWSSTTSRSPSCPERCRPNLLRARLAAADGDAVAILKLGRTFDKVREALSDTGLLDRARYAERAGTDAQRVAPLADVDPATVPYMSLALVPGRGQRPGAPARRDGHRAWPRRPGVAHARVGGGDRRRHRPGGLPGLPGTRAEPAGAAPPRLGEHRRGRPGGARPRPGGEGRPGRGDLLRRPRRVRDGVGGAGAGRVGPRTDGRTLASRSCQASPRRKPWRAGPARRSATTTA